MISKNELKYFTSLLQKKFRQQEEKFIVDGLKIVEEGLNSSYKCEVVIVTPVSYTHLRAHETVLDIVCRLLLEKKKSQH